LWKIEASMIFSSSAPIKKKEDIGLSPYEIKFRGQRKSDKVKMTVFDFDENRLSEYKIENENQLEPMKNPQTTTWLNIDGLHNEDLMKKVAATFSIPSDVMSDILDPQLRPTVEDFDTGLYVSIRMLEFNEKSGKIYVDNLSLFLTETLLISFQEKPGDVFDPVRERIRKNRAKIRTSGSDYLAFALLDVIIDNYIYILGRIGDKIEEVEEKMITSFDKEFLQKINVLKSELNKLRREIKPAKEMILNLMKLDTDFIHESNHTHYKELQDNINQATEQLDYYREVLYDEVDMYHSFMSTKLNDIMAVLTAFSVIFIPLTFIVGVYGTNFSNIPELHWQYGYLAMWIVMIIMAIIMLIYFKRKNWW